MTDSPIPSNCCFSLNSEKNVRGWPPVAPQNLPACPTTRLPKEKSRPAAAPRRSAAGTCQKPPANTFRVAQHRWSVCASDGVQQGKRI
jgi:hypothetical protein